MSADLTDHLALGRTLLTAIEDKLQRGGYGSNDELSSDTTLVVAHALLDIAESLREHLPGRIA